jgi:dTDP-glucose 4,6-dehydratase
VNVLLTGAAGFAGSYIAEAITQEGGHVVALDCLTYAGKLSNLENIPREQLTFVCHDFRMPLTPHLLEYIGEVDYIIHNGAETHVTSSFENPELFVQSNVVGTLNMLEAARILKPKVFVYTSTDEVFGQSDGRAFTETDALNPSNPYSASKAAGEMLVKTYHKSYGIPYLITRTTNMFGKRQHEEKFLPKIIKKFIADEMVQIHADENGNLGSRQWIHVSDQAAALMFLLQSGQRNNTFHIAGIRKSNWEVAEAVATRQGQPLFDFQYLHHAVWVGPHKKAQIINAYDSWQSHDLHYNLDDSKIRALGWAPKLTFEQGLEQTV